ncbi:hypothetical protein F4677DRAFT_460924 [Hypoxylon crocopeplum]|nr:hypothetical protein F4677DRAFT_460924 [Hypoxylon crocopeplum]
MATICRVTGFVLILPLPILAFSTPTPNATPTSTSESSEGVSWTVTGLQLSDIATPNPLWGGVDRFRKLDFFVSGATLAQQHRCRVDTGYYQGDSTPQFGNWTYRCWDLDKVRLGDDLPVDPALSFKFDSEVADRDPEHPATFWLKQELGDVEAKASVDISMYCGLPYLPYGCGPCFEYQCNGTTFVIHSD